MVKANTTPAVFGIRSITAGSSDANNTSNSIAAPGDAVTGDLMVVIYCSDVAQSPATATGGWTKVGNANAAGSDGVLCAFAGIIGTATTPLVVTTNTGSHGAWLIYLIPSASSTVSDVKIATATGFSTNPDPPSLNPAQGSTPKLWIAAGGGPAFTLMPSAGPSGFGNFSQTYCNASGGSGSPHVSFATASLLDSSSTKDPGAFTAGSAFWSALTVSVLGI